MAATPKPMRKGTKSAILKEKKRASHMDAPMKKHSVKEAKKKIKTAEKGVKAFTRGTGKY